MESVGKGLAKMREAEGGLRTGLIADEVQVTFNISASGTDSSKLYVEMTPIPATPAIGGKAGAELSNSITAQRGNQITIKFKNIMTASTKDTLIPNTTELDKLFTIFRTTWGSSPEVFFAPR
jgi:hypothetical protein